jgi:hypothetical protein
MPLQHNPAYNNNSHSNNNNNDDYDDDNNNNIYIFRPFRSSSDYNTLILIKALLLYLNLKDYV